MLDFLFSLLKDKTIILVTHQLETIQAYPFKIYDLKKQQWIVSQKTKDTYSKPISLKKQSYHILRFEFKNIWKRPLLFISLCFIFLLTCYSFCQLFSFSKEYQKTISHHFNQYLDCQVLKIMNYDSFIGQDFHFEVYDDLEPFTDQLQILVNGNPITYQYFKPVKNLSSLIAMNQLFFENNFLESQKENKLSLFYEDFEWTFSAIPVVLEDALFTKPCIYYDYDYFVYLLKEQNFQGMSLYETFAFEQNNSKLYFIEDNFFSFYESYKNHFLFKNHLLSSQHQADKSYFHSDALLDFFTNQLLYQASKNIMEFFFIFCVISSFLSLYFLTKAYFLHTIKKIAIYLQMGATYFECFFNFFIINISFLMIFPLCNIFFFHFNIFLFLIALFLLFFIQSSVIFYLIQKFERKDLITFLKDDSIC